MSWLIIKSSKNIFKISAWTKLSKNLSYADNFLQYNPRVRQTLVACLSDVSNSQKNLSNTVMDVERRWSEKFENERISEPIESIQYIIAHVLGISRITDLITLNEQKLNSEQLQKLEQLCECRLLRMPIQYIIGEWDFRDITLKLEPPIFIPRPETEVLVDFLIKRIATYKQERCKILEIGCGSGAISLSLLHSNKDINIVAIDINSHACELTDRNARNLKLDDRISILNASLEDNGTIDVKKEYSVNKPINLEHDKFDFIVSNPPYIPTETIFKLQPEINLYEDLKALDGGTDGLKLIKPILKYASKVLNTNGILFLETDPSHVERIKYLVNKLYENNLKFEHVYKDFCNNDRFVEILKIK